MAQLSLDRIDIARPFQITVSIDNGKTDTEKLLQATQECRTALRAQLPFHLIQVKLPRGNEKSSVIDVAPPAAASAYLGQAIANTIGSALALLATTVASRHG